MGTYHFMGVGRAVGAVSCAVDYIEKSLTQIESGTANSEIERLFAGSGGIRHKEDAIGKIEALVLFSSREVVQRELKAFSFNGSGSPGFVRDEIEKQLKKVWKRYNPKEGAKIFWVEVEVDNYQDCFKKALQVARRFSPRGKQGKEIWLNLTGGTNTLGLALLSMARITGVSTKHYLIAQSKDYKEHVSVPPQINLQPDKDNYFNVLPFVKLAVDTVYFYEILLELSQLDREVTNEELYGLMCQKRVHFRSLTLEEFKREYLLKLLGLGYTSYSDETGLSAITAEGHAFINDLYLLEVALEQEDALAMDDTDIVEASKQWSWFHRSVLEVD